MPSWAQRLLTVATGGALVALGAAVHGAEALIPAGLAVIGWAMPHPADRNGKDHKQ